MSRTTAEDVAAIIEVDSTIALTAFIDAASAIVDDHCATYTGYTTARLKTIETWLAACLYAIRDRARTHESPGDGVSESKQHVEALGFDCNEWGQMAMRLDHNGGLARLNEQTKSGVTKTVSVAWLGKESTTIQNL